MAIAAPQKLNMADRMLIRASIVQRCTAAVANYALYILGEDTQTPNHANRYSWASGAINEASLWGERTSWYVLNQTSFLNGGSSIDDAELAGIIENTLNEFFIAAAP